MKEKSRDLARILLDCVEKLLFEYVCMDLLYRLEYKWKKVQLEETINKILM